MENQTIQNILTQISAINKKYEKIAEVTGESFNIFRILKVEKNEVYTHSAILCELLNPNGSHGCKDTFLKLFIEQQKETFQKQQKFIERLTHFDSLSSTAISEEYIGHKNDDGTEGGRIDIVIKDKTNKAIVIENKIDAIDQPKQLVCYNAQYPTAPIFYLTLDGHKPCDDSKGELNEGEVFVCISYKEHVTKWLEGCRKEAVTHPILRETITQYINSIKYLTHQTINENMKNEMIEFIVKSSENIQAAEEIKKNWDGIELAILQKLKEKINSIAIELDMHVAFGESERNPLGKDDTGFWFYKDGWKHCIYFYFEGKEYSLLSGIDNLNDAEECDVEKFTREFKDFVIEKKLKSDTSYNNWIWVEQFSAWNTTSWSELLNKIPNEIKEQCKKIIKKLESIN